MGFARAQPILHSLGSGGRDQTGGGIMRGRLSTAALLALAAACWSPSGAQAQERAPTAAEMGAIAACAEANRDNVEEGERKCIFRLVAERCLKRTRQSNPEM